MIGFIIVIFNDLLNGYLKINCLYLSKYIFTFVFLFHFTYFYFCLCGICAYVYLYTNKSSFVSSVILESIKKVRGHKVRTPGLE